MSTTRLTFDSRSGRILSVHVGAEDEAQAIERTQRYSKIQTEHIGVIAVPADAVEPGRQYKVDVERGELVPASEEEGGTSFSYGSSVQSPGSVGSK